MNWIEAVLSAGVYLGQILCTIFAAAILCVLTVVLCSAAGVKGPRRHKAVSFLACLAVVCALTGYLAYRPLIYCPPKYSNQLTQELKGEMRSISSGPYSKKIPLFPVCITVETIQPDRVVFRTQYLYYGSTVHEISDGISLVKPIFHS